MAMDLRPQNLPHRGQVGTLSTAHFSRKFRSKFGTNLGQSYILYTKDLMEKDGILHLPLYMAMFL